MAHDVYITVMPFYQRSENITEDNLRTLCYSSTKLRARVKYTECIECVKTSTSACAVNVLKNRPPCKETTIVGPIDTLNRIDYHHHSSNTVKDKDTIQTLRQDNVFTKSTSMDELGSSQKTSATSVSWHERLTSDSSCDVIDSAAQNTNTIPGANTRHKGISHKNKLDKKKASPFSFSSSSDKASVSASLSQNGPFLWPSSSAWSWCRSRLLLLTMLFYVLQGVSGSCGDTPFTDPVSSALLADVVIEGKVKDTTSPDSNGLFSVEVSIRKKVLKGVDLLNRTNSGKQTRKVTVSKFHDKNEDPKNCIGSVKVKKTYIFFLKDIGDKKGLHYSLSAMPMNKSRKVLRRMRKFLCEKCAKSPRIRNLTGSERIGSGEDLHIKCKARAKPDPIFTWYKDGVLLKSGKDGVKIRNSRRASRLKVRRASARDTGSYECVASNAVGDDRRAMAVTVTDSRLSARNLKKSPPTKEVVDRPQALRELHRNLKISTLKSTSEPAYKSTTPLVEHTTRRKIPCESQNLCFNGGTCFRSEALSIEFCQCLIGWTGKRCEMIDAIAVREDYNRQATLLFERTLIVIGVVITVLVLIVICIASYILAKRRRRRFEERRQKRANRRAQAEAAGNVNSNANPQALKNGIYIDSTAVPSYPVNQPAAHNLAHDHQNNPISDQDNRQTQPLLRNEAVKETPPTRGRLEASSSMYDNCGDGTVPWKGSTDQPQGKAAVSGDPVESIEMQPLRSVPEPVESEEGTTTALLSKPPRSEADGSVQEEDQPSSPERPTDGNDTPVSRPYSCSSPDPTPPPYHQVVVHSVQPDTPQTAEVEILPPPSNINHTHSPQDSSSSSSHPLSLQDHDETDTAEEPLLPPQPPSPHNRSSSVDELISKAALPSPRRRNREPDSAGYESDGYETQKLLRDTNYLHGPSHSHTFPRAKVNGLDPEIFDDISDDDDDEDDEATEVPYEKRDDLHISEDDLNLSSEDLKCSSFNSVLTPSRQISMEDGPSGGTTPLLPGSPRRHEMRKYLSEDTSPTPIFNKDPRIALENVRSLSVDHPTSANPYSTTKSHNMGVLNSTLAGSPVYEGAYPLPRSTHRDNCAEYDPTDDKDSTPWLTANYENLTEEERDIKRRLKDVRPDQQAIHI